MVSAQASEKRKQPDDSYADARAPDGVAIGDRIILFFSDDQRRISLRLTDAAHDLEKGLLSSTSPLGEAVQGVEEGDEIEFDQEDGRRRKALIESVDKGVQRERFADMATPVVVNAVQSSCEARATPPSYGQ